jgi:ABC-type glycerol-3-phosphate transport system substrate-binding protein
VVGVSDYSLINFHKPPGNATRFGVTSVPGGTAGRRAGTLGGNGLAVSVLQRTPVKR